MLDSVLIANRGEIACRVIRTARRLGLRTIAVYSTADRGALHTRLADEAVEIGPAEARDSYLDAARILKAAEQTGAASIHPGYGFLSENAGFARACRKARIVFVGPPAEAIQRMGSKSEARQLMAAAGVPVLPGYDGKDQSEALLEAEARRLGFPLLVKPTAGGGGKGMRIVRSAPELGEALAGARREARQGVRRLERAARALRREGPPRRDPGLRRHPRQRDPPLRARLLAAAPPPEGHRGGARARASTRRRARRWAQAAVAAARAVGYVGAGTVEFLFDGARVLLPRDEHAPAGRAPGHRDDHRNRPGRVAAARRERRVAAAAAGAGRAPWPRGRGPALRRGSRARLPAFHRPPRAPALPGRPRALAGGHRRPGGRRGLGSLRSRCSPR